MSDESFQKLWKAAVRYRRASLVTETLLRAVYEAASDVRVGDEAVEAALELLLSYLASKEGRTDANCCATDAFFSTGWEGGWSHLSQPVQDLLNDLGGTLHDAIYAPHIAANFSSLPEQLLARIRAIRADGK